MARRAVIVLDVEGMGEARADAERLEQALSDMGDRARFVGQGFDDLEQGAAENLREVRIAAERTESQTRQMVEATDHMSSSTGNANQAVFALGDALQDATSVGGNFSDIARASGNNLAFMAESLIESNQGLSGFASSLLGVGGVMVGLQALIAIGPKVVSFFTESEEAAREAGKAYAEATSQLLNVQADLPAEQVALGVERSRQLLQGAETRIGEVEDRLEHLRGLQDFMRGAVFRETDIPLEDIGTAVQAVEQTQITLAQLRQARREGTDELRQQIEGRIGNLRTELSALKGQRDEIESQVQEAEALKSIYETLPEDVQEQAEAQASAADEAERQADEVERAASAMNALTVSAKQAAQNAQVVQRFMQQRGQMPMQRQLQAFGQQRMPTIGGTMLQQGQSQGELMLESAREAGIISDFQSLGDILGAQAEEAGQSIDQNVNRTLVQGIQLSSQLGATLAQAAQEGSASFQQIFGSVLQTIGGVIGVANPAAGAGIAGAGTIIQQLQHGGNVRSPIQLVGERGPELVSLPMGSEVHSTPNTREIIRASMDMSGMEAHIAQLTRKVEMLAEQPPTVKLDPYAVQSELSEVQSEKAAFTAT